MGVYNNLIYQNLIYLRGVRLKRVFSGIKSYLTDWKNLLTHSLVGVLILLIALYAPVSPYVRMGFVGCVVGFNVFRMKYLDQ